MPPETQESRSRCILLDRDGTINVDCGYLSRPEQVELLPHAAEGLRAMSELGFGLVVVTNQSGIGRGYFDEQALKAVHIHLEELLAAEGVKLTAIYHCPHHSDDHCECRKPAPGMVHRAAAEHGFDPAQSFMIGDKRCDMALGHAVGAQSIVIRGPGNDWNYEASATAQRGPDHVANHLGEAADAIRGYLQIEKIRNNRSQLSVMSCGEDDSL